MSQINYVDSETLWGTVNGINKIFTSLYPVDKVVSFLIGSVEYKWYTITSGVFSIPPSQTLTGTSLGGNGSTPSAIAQDFIASNPLFSGVTLRKNTGASATANVVVSIRSTISWADIDSFAYTSTQWNALVDNVDFNTPLTATLVVGASYYIVITSTGIFSIYGTTPSWYAGGRFYYFQSATWFNNSSYDFYFGIFVQIPLVSVGKYILLSDAPTSIFGSPVMSYFRSDIVGYGTEDTNMIGNIILP